MWLLSFCAAKTSSAAVPVAIAVVIMVLLLVALGLFCYLKQKKKGTVKSHTPEWFEQQRKTTRYADHVIEYIYISIIKVLDLREAKLVVCGERFFVI